MSKVRGAIPVEDLKMIAANVVGTGRPVRELPESVRRITGNIVVALSDGDFASQRRPDDAYVRPAGPLSPRTFHRRGRPVFWG